MESSSLSSLASSSSNSLGQSQLASRDLGKRVCYTLKGREEKRGVLHYIGQPDFAPGEWAGIVLDRAEGKNNGSVQGVRYFTCDEGCGVFVRSDKVTLDPRPAPRSQPTSRPGSRPLSRHASRHPSREGSPVIQRRAVARMEVDGLPCPRSSSHLPRIPPGDVIPGSDLDHLLKALQPAKHTITTSPPKKRGPMKAFAMKATRDGARSAMDRNRGAAETVTRSKSTLHLSSPKPEHPKARRANSMDLSSGPPLRPKSPKRERKPTDEGKGGSKEKTAASPKKPKINSPLGKQPKTSTPKDAVTFPSLAANTSLALQSDQGESPFPSQGVVGDVSQSTHEEDSPSAASCSSSHCSATTVSSVAPDSYSLTPSRMEMDGSVGNPGNQAFMKTPHFSKPVSPFNEGACTTLSQAQLPHFPYQSPSFGTELHKLSLCQSHALLSNANSNNSNTSCQKPNALAQPLGLNSLPKQLKESVGSLHYNPPHHPLPQPNESTVRVRFTNRRSGASMPHPLSAVTATPQSTPPPQPQPQASQSSLATSLAQSTVTEDTLHAASLSPPSDDALSIDSGRPWSHDTSPSSLVDCQSPLAGNSTSISPDAEQSTLVLTNSQLEELAALPREDIVERFRKVYKTFRKRISHLKKQVKVPSPGSSEEVTPERTRAELSGLREEMKEAHTEHLREMRDNYDQEIERLQEKHSMELKDAVMKLEDDQSMEIEMLKRAYSVALQEIEEKHTQELTDLKRKHQRGKETIEEELRIVKERCCALEAHVQLHVLSLYDDNDENSIV